MTRPKYTCAVPTREASAAWYAALIEPQQTIVREMAQEFRTTIKAQGPQFSLEDAIEVIFALSGYTYAHGQARISPNTHLGEMA